MAELTDRQLSILRNVFRAHPEIDRVILYGSRAKGTATERSDIDLAVIGSIGRHELSRLKLDLEETDLPVGVDLTDYQELANPRFKAQIDRSGQEIYRRETA